MLLLRIKFIKVIMFLLLSSSSMVFAGPSPEPYDPNKTFETTYTLGDLSIKTYRPKVENQYDVGCFKEKSNIPDLERICSVSNFGSKSEIEIIKNGKTIIIGEQDKITEGEDIGTYRNDYIELYDRRKTIGFLIAESKGNGNCFPNCYSAYLINPVTLETFDINYYVDTFDLKDAFAVCSGGELFLDCEARYCNLRFFYETYFNKTSKRKIKTFKTTNSCAEGVRGLGQKQNTVEYFEKERTKIIKKFKKEGINIPKEQHDTPLDL